MPSSPEAPEAPEAPAIVALEDSILDAFVDLADSLVADYDPLDFLYRLLDHSIPLTGAAAGAVLLHYEGSLHLVAASDEDAEAVELFEVQNSAGPARDAFHTGKVVRVSSMDDAAERWPDFARAAGPYGWSAVFAVPLRLRETIAGSFVVFWSADGHAIRRNWDEKLLQGFADVATIAVLQQRGTAALQTVNQQLHTALSSRIKVEQAKGMVAQAAGLRLGEAFDMIRRHARSQGTRVTDIAAAVIAGDLTVDALTAPLARR